MKNRAYAHLAFILTIALLLPIGALRAEGDQEDDIPIEIEGDSVQFIKAENKAVATGNVVIVYKDMRLTCDEASVYMDRKDGIAKGNAVFTQGATRLEGDQITYNFKTKEAQVVTAKFDFPPWSGGSVNINKATDNQITLNKGYITTCALDKPHYRIQARKIKIYPGRKIIAYHALLFIGDVPVMYLPVFIAPLFDRRPGVSIVPGVDKEWGAFVLTTWRFYINESFKGHIKADYRERKDFAWGGELKYDLKEYGYGLLDTYYMNERNLEDKHPLFSRDQGPEVDPVNERQRYKIQMRHNWQIDPFTHFVGEIHKFSDDKILKDYFYNDFVRDTEPKTFVSVVHGKDNYILSLLIDKRMNRFDTVVERLPEVRLEVLSTKIRDTHFYFKSEEIVSKLESKHDTYSGTSDFEALRLDSFNELSYQKKLLKFLSVKPFIGTRQTYYSEDARSDKGENRIRGQFLTGVDLSAKFFKILPYSTNFLNLDIAQMRHVITPSISYFYNSRPTLPASQLHQFDSIDAIKKLNGVTLSLENKLQAKRGTGIVDLEGDLENNLQAKRGMSSVDLVRAIVSTDYLFKHEDTTEGKSLSRWSEVKFDLELRPYSWLFIDTESYYDPKTRDFNRVYVDVVARNNKWYLGIGHRYEQNSSTLMTGELQYKLNKKWKFKIYERYEFKTNELERQEYTFTRDMHAWFLDIIYNIGDGESVLVIFRLKAFPEMPLRFSTSYHQPQTNLLAVAAN